MEGKSIDSPNLDSIFASESDDFKYICTLGTILVATIQEVKARVSQIELIFCSQLFPKFQSNSKSFQRKQEEWKKRETNLLSQIGELKLSLLEEISEDREKLLKEIECKDQSLVTEQSKRRDMERDFDTLKESYNSLKSQYTDLIEKLEGNSGNLKFSERAVEEKKVKPHSSKRSHEDFDEINTEEISPYTELRKPKLLLNSMSTSARSPPKCISDNEEKITWCQTNKECTSPSTPSFLPKSTSVKITETLLDQKQPTTWWDTRANWKPCGADLDPHDDFLDTWKSKPDISSTTSARGAPVPRETCRDKLAVKEPTAFQVPLPQAMDFNISDEETQDLTLI